MKTMSLDSYKRITNDAADQIEAHAKNLCEIARFLRAAPDFSPAVLRLVVTANLDVKPIATTLRAVGLAIKQRGFTYHAEAARALRVGTLQINRRDPIDAAAE